jgi:predicted metalloprotease with PDZ domain
VLQLARGALHATELENALRAQGSSLVALLARLLTSETAELTPPAWLDALRSAAGAPALRSEEEFSRGQPVLLAGTAFGPCFSRERTRYAESTLGLPDEANADHLPWTLTTLDPSSPAFAAGLRPGAVVQAIDHVSFDAERPIRLVLADGSRIEYLGPRRTVRSYAWKRVPGVHESLCRMSGRHPRPLRRQ